MKKILAVIVLGLVLSGNAYAFVIKIGSENLAIVTDPPGAMCELKNNKGIWAILTPGKMKVKRSKNSLEITCNKEGYKKFIRSYNLKDPKTFNFNDDLAWETGNTIGAAATGDIFGVVLHGGYVITDAVMNKFGTYATDKKNGKPFIYIKLKK